MLGELGYNTRRVTNATDALRLVKDDEPIDLVLSDMIMPGKMNGLELARQVSRHNPDLPVVLMTGFSEAAASAAAEGFPLLAKPYTMEALGETLGQARRAKHAPSPA
jgi:CheY-like chemotaxis protein